MPKQHRVSVVILALVLAVVLAPGGRAYAAPHVPEGLGAATGDDIVAIRPEFKAVEPGETFTVDVKIEGPSLVIASDVQILFDTRYLEGVAVVHSGVFDGYFVDHSDLPAGKIWVGGGTFGTRTPPFIYVTLTFRARDRIGITALRFNPEEVYVEGQHGSVRGGLIDGTVKIGSGNPHATLHLPLVAGGRQ